MQLRRESRRIQAAVGAMLEELTNGGRDGQHSARDGKGEPEKQQTLDEQRQFFAQPATALARFLLGQRHLRRFDRGERGHFGRGLLVDLATRLAGLNTSRQGSLARREILQSGKKHG